MAQAMWVTNSIRAQVCRYFCLSLVMGWPSRAPIAYSTVRNRRPRAASPSPNRRARAMKTSPRSGLLRNSWFARNIPCGIARRTSREGHCLFRARRIVASSGGEVAPLPAVAIVQELVFAQARSAMRPARQSDLRIRSFRERKRRTSKPRIVNHRRRAWTETTGSGYGFVGRLGASRPAPAPDRHYPLHFRVARRLCDPLLRRAAAGSFGAYARRPGGGHSVGPGADVAEAQAWRYAISHRILVIRLLNLCDGGRLRLGRSLWGGRLDHPTGGGKRSRERICGGRHSSHPVHRRANRSRFAGADHMGPSYRGPSNGRPLKPGNRAPQPAERMRTASRRTNRRPASRPSVLHDKAPTFPSEAS